MADDNKTRTKNALLGELESIKTLLDDDSDIIDFGDDDPPILTTAVDAADDD